jgi:hypothetical protein
MGPRGFFFDADSVIKSFYGLHGINDCGIPQEDLFWDTYSVPETYHGTVTG